LGIGRIYPEEPLSLYIKEIYHASFTNEDRIPVLDDCCHDLVIFREADARLYCSEFTEGIEINHHIFSISNISPPFSIEFPKSLNFITVKFQPWCNQLFFGEKWKPGINDVSQHFKPIFKTNDASEFFEMDDPFEVMQLKLKDYIKPFNLSDKQRLLKQIIELIYQQSGQLKVNDLEKRFELSRQYLNKLFKEEVQYSIKHFIGMVRVMNAVKIQLHNPKISMTKLAYEVGYYDQAHFVRDFQKVAGMSPKKFFNLNGAFFQRHKA